MKKRFLHIVAFFALAAGLSLTSCSKEDPAESIPNEPASVSMEKTATITGYVVTIDDISVTTPVYSAPSAANFKMYVSIPYTDLMGSNYQGLVTEWTTTDVAYDASTGKYTVTVPVGFSGSNVTLTLASYAGTQKELDGTATVTANGIWEAPSPFQVTVNENGEVFYETAVKHYIFIETSGIKGDKI
jgi:hypothetical protein